jgi:hypothetical protein
MFRFLNQLKPMRYFFLILFLFRPLFSEFINIEAGAEGPWFTGTLLTPSPFTIPNGHSNVSPYLVVTDPKGKAETNSEYPDLIDRVSSINLLFFGQTGLSDRLDFTLVPNFAYNYSGNESTWVFGDLYSELGIQITRQGENAGYTTKFAIGEMFPTGTYQHLKPQKYQTDFSGTGSFSTFFKFCFGKRWFIYNQHYLAFRMEAGSILNTQVRVFGYNTYGGDETTKGRVFPGPVFPLLMGFEYNLTRNWALALDIATEYSLPVRFKGVTRRSVGTGSTYSLSFAPAIEYNFSSDIGLIAGVWVAAYRHNLPYFINYVASLSWYI